MQQMVPLQLPATLRGDFSGVVAEVGAGVSDFKKGDEVYGYASILGGGSVSFAEFVSKNWVQMKLWITRINPSKICFTTIMQSMTQWVAR